MALVTHFWMKLLQQNNHPNLDGSSHPLLDETFTKNNHPNLDGSSHPLLDGTFAKK